MSIDQSNYAQMVDVTQEGEVKQLPVGGMFDEMGGTGLKRSAGVIDEEFMPALRGTKGVAVFREMSLNDYTVGSLLFTIEMLLRQIDWTVTGDDTSPEQSEAVQFVEECMDDMSHSWNDMIAEILSMLTYGWAWHEIVYKKRVGPWETDPKKRSKFTDGRIGWRKMPIRAQETLFRWIFDVDGGIKGLVQIPPPDYTQRTLSIEKGLLFRTGIHKGNPEGRSILRNAYRPWYFKKRLEEFEAIGVERDLAGLPFAKIPSRLMDPNASPAEKQMYAAFKKLVANVRRDEHEGVVIPSDVDAESKAPKYDFQLLASGGSRTFDTNALIGRYELAILSTVLADFLKLGHEGQGSYAMHVDKTGIFRAALNTIATAIADVFNRYAIPRLFAANSWKLDKLPKIEPSNVDPPNLAELGQFMTSMAGLGMTFFPDPDLEKYLRDTAHLPALSEEQEEMHRMMSEQANAMEFMGAKQKAEMVGQGMTPEQAQMQSEMPTPEMQAQDPQAQATNQKMQMDQAASEQKMAQEAQSHSLQQATQAQGLEQATKETDLKAKQGEAELATEMKRMQMELDAMKAKMGLEAEGSKQTLDAKAKGSALDLKAKEASTKADLDAKRRGNVIDLKAKQAQAKLRPQPAAGRSKGRGRVSKNGNLGPSNGWGWPNDDNPFRRS